MKLRLVNSIASFVLFSLAQTTITALERDLRRQKVPRVRAFRTRTVTTSDTKRVLSRGLLRDLSALNSFFEEESTFWLTRGLLSISLSLPADRSMHPTNSPSHSDKASMPPASTSMNPLPTSAPNPPPPFPQATLAPTTTVRLTAPPTTATYTPSSSTSILVPTAESPPTSLPTFARFTPSPSPAGTAELPPSASAVDTPTIGPSSSPNIELPVIFMCTKPEEWLGLAQPPFDAITAIPFKVGYVVESSNLLEAYIGSIELHILEAAAAGALQCNTGGPLFGQNCSGTCLNVISQSVKTVKTGQLCEPEISECMVYETSFEILVADNVDPEVSAFLGYVLLREEMDEGDFILDNPVMDRIEYLSPLPLLPPPDEDSLKGQPLEDSGISSDQATVSPWTLGTVVTMSVVGAIALGAWLRKRRNRNQRHQHLFEETSVESPVHSTHM